VPKFSASVRQKHTASDGKRGQGGELKVGPAPRPVQAVGTAVSSGTFAYWSPMIDCFINAPPPSMECSMHVAVQINIDSLDTTSCLKVVKLEEDVRAL